jgi:hypothetical protein
MKAVLHIITTVDKTASRQIDRQSFFIGLSIYLSTGCLINSCDDMEYSFHTKKTLISLSIQQQYMIHWIT